MPSHRRPPLELAGRDSCGSPWRQVSPLAAARQTASTVTTSENQQAPPSARITAQWWTKSANRTNRSWTLCHTQSLLRISSDPGFSPSAAEPETANAAAAPRDARGPSQPPRVCPMARCFCGCGRRLRFRGRIANVYGGNAQTLGEQVAALLDEELSTPAVLPLGRARGDRVHAQAEPARRRPGALLRRRDRWRGRARPP